jgi:hypothetical protein
MCVSRTVANGPAMGTSGFMGATVCRRAGPGTGGSARWGRPDHQGVTNDPAADLPAHRIVAGRKPPTEASMSTVRDPGINAAWEDV